MNLPYCRFQNTLSDFRDCINALNDGVELTANEYTAAIKLYNRAKEMVETFTVEDFRNLKERDEE